MSTFYKVIRASSLLAFSCCLALPPRISLAAASSEVTAAQKLITEGLELRRAGKDADALRRFEAAHGLSPTPRAAAQWGLCLQAVGRWADADNRLSEALQAKTDPWIVKNRSTLKDSLEQVKQHVARVEVHGEPAGAHVVINGHKVGSYPLKDAIAVNEGNVDIEVTMPGYQRGYRALTISGGQYQSILIRLEEVQRKQQATDVVPPASSAALPLAAKDDVTVQSNVGTTGDTRPLYQRPWVWIVAGAVVAAVVIGVASAAGGGDPTPPMADDRGVFEQ